MIETMRITDWRNRVQAQLAGRGRKAALAEWLAAEYGRTPRSWQKTIQNILSRQVPGGELVLAIDYWLRTDGK